MKYVKMLGLAAVAAAALMAFAGAGTASAAGVLCSTTADPCPTGQRVVGPLDFSLVAGGSAILETTGGVVVDTCSAATVKGSLTTNEAGKEATGTNEVISWGTGATPCTKPATTIALGKLRINNIAGTSNGTVIADETIKVTIPGLFSGENCVYGLTAGDSIGDLTEGNPAIFHANAIPEKLVEPNHSCTFGPADTRWTATYQLTTPATTVSVSTG